MPCLRFPMSLYFCQPYSSPHIVPLLCQTTFKMYPSGRFSSSAGKKNRKERKNVGLMWVHASSSRVAGTPLTPHLCNGLGTEICSFRLGGTNPESQHFWVSGRAAAFLRGISADDALCNGCNGSLLQCCTVAGMHLPRSKTN